MNQYKATSGNARNFSLSRNDQSLGELVYTKWYSFDAKIILSNNKKYQLVPDGFWGSVIQLRDGESVLLEFKLGWKGIIISINNQDYLLKLKGLLSIKFIVADTNDNEIIAVAIDLKWTKIQTDYSIETAPAFDTIQHKELFLFATIHAINYYLSFNSGM